MFGMHHSERMAIFCGLALLVGFPIQAAAQLEEVIVTAQRKAENLQDVPIAISALSAEAIEKSGIHELSSIAVRVPGLSFTAFSPGQNIVSIRGASSNDDGAGTDGSVAMFVDDVYLGRISNINPELFDLERIEVLRGPQGTLYGKNTIGGAINVVSTRPNLEQFEGKVKVGFGNYGRIDLAGLVTGPLSENLAFKLSGNFRNRDGWVDNKVLNKEQRDDNTKGLKAQLLYEDDRTEWLLTFDYNDLDVADMGRVPLRFEVGGNPGVFRSGYVEACGDRSNSDGSCSAGPIDGYAKREARGVSSKFVVALTENVELTSITAYREAESDWNMDSIGSPMLPLNNDIFDITEQISQEFRITGNPNEQINYVAGLWYLGEKTDRTECFDLNGGGPAGAPGAATLDAATAGTDCTPLTDGSEGYQQINEADSYALFGQVDIELTERLKLVIGGRYSYEEKSIINRAVTNERLPGTPATGCVGRGNQPGYNASGLCIIAQNFGPLLVKDSWNAFTPKVSLSFQLRDDANVYVVYSEGFKSGGFAAAPQTEEDARRTLDQEEATNIEVGFKGVFGGILRLNASIFRVEYKGLQIQNFGTPANQVGAFGRFLTFNAGDAEVTGLEAEATVLIGNNLTLAGFFGYNDSEFGTTNIANAAASADQKGNQLLRAPKYKYGFNADWALPFSGGSVLNLTGSYNFTDKQRQDLPGYAIQPSFELVDLRLSWTNAKDNLEISAWMENALDEEYISHIYTVAGGNMTAVYGTPRTFGVSTLVRF